MLVHLKEIVRKTKKALGAFDTFNLEITRGIIAGAVQAESPIVIQVTPKTMMYAGVKTISQMIKTLADDQGKETDIALHLDHGKTISQVRQCVECGFSSVMIDASDKPFEQNILITKEAAQYAHRHNVMVQSELGLVGKGKIGYQTTVLRPENFLTDPDQAQEFVKKTNTDTLAVAIGNVHGYYKMEKGVPKLFLSRLREIRKKVDVPLVLHGASGIPAAQIREAVKLGIKIINIDTEIRMAFKKSLQASLKRRNRKLDPREILTPVIKGVSSVVRNKIRIFNQ